MIAVVLYISYDCPFVTDKIDEVEAFLKAHPLTGVERGMQQMLEGMRTVSEFADRIGQGPLATDAFWSSL
jgi:hypothetical protein